MPSYHTSDLKHCGGNVVSYIEQTCMEESVIIWQVRKLKLQDIK